MQQSYILSSQLIATVQFVICNSDVINCAALASNKALLQKSVEEKLIWKL